VSPSLPVLLDLHAQLEKHLPTEQNLNLLSGFGTYGLQYLAAFTDHDSFLRFALDVDGAADLKQSSVPLLLVLGNNRDRVRDLLARATQDLLSHEFCNEQRRWLVGRHPRWVIHRPLRHQGLEQLLDDVEPVA
jgi:hypothetical protein